MSTSGRVLDWSIEGLKTLSGATGSQLEDDWQDQTLPADGVSAFCLIRQYHILMDSQMRCFTVTLFHRFFNIGSLFFKNIFLSSVFRSISLHVFLFA